MQLAPAEMTEAEIYSLMCSSIVPRPIAWITSVDENGTVNLAPFSYFMGVCCDPMTILFCPVYGDIDRPKKDTLLNVEKVPEFVVNVADQRNANAVNLSATPLPYGQSEIEYVGVTPVPSTMVRPPRVGEAPIAFECRVSNIVEIKSGPGGGWVVFGTVLMVHAADNVLDQATLRADVSALQPVGRLGGWDFVRTTDIFTLPRHNAVPEMPAAGEKLLAWVAENAQTSITSVTRHSQLLGAGSVLDSLALVSLTVLVEELLGRPLRPDEVADMNSFATVDNILKTYF